MPRKKLDRPNPKIEVVIPYEDKEALIAYCNAQSRKTTITQVVLRALAPYIAEGRKLLDRELGP